MIIMNLKLKYKTIFYNTNSNNSFITVLIIAHGADLINSMPYNENTNTLIFNLSSVPNIVSKSFKDDELETTLNYIMPILNNKPNKYNIEIEDLFVLGSSGSKIVSLATGSAVGVTTSLATGSVVADVGLIIVVTVVLVVTLTVVEGPAVCDIEDVFGWLGTTAFDTFSFIGATGLSFFILIR